MDTEGGNRDAELVCKRCEANRPNNQAHHCSTCKRCVLEMQHHCMFIDNCVGKNTIKHFINYALCMCLFLVALLVMMLKGFYAQNQASGLGVQGLTDLRPHLFFVEVL